MNEKTSEDLSFGEWLRQRRHILDLTQQELADQVGCARITLRRIEAGALKPSRELAQILLEKLGIPEAEREIWIRFARGLSPLPEKSTESFTSQPATNLPVSLTSFIGRAKEQQEIINLVDKYPLVTLIGPGGIGKTRLALHAGQELLKDYPDGVWLVELASILDPLLVPRITAIAIGLRDEPQRPVIDMLSDYLREKQMLIIIDNCEHVLDTCARLVDTLLKNCPGLKILATSRESLGIMGEAMYRVPPLGLPDREQLREKIKDHESVRLFEERAQLVQIGFLVTAENASSIAKICCQLDGIPLAIELAAARVKMFSTEQIAARLEQSFNLLNTGHRTSLPRHQTLQAAIDWSHDLLYPAEQTLFRRLSVFVDGWTLEAAEFVCSDGNIKSEDILDLLSQLINKSLVTTEHRQNETRYRMLETIRQYANEKLMEPGESDLLRARHLDYFLYLAETAEPHLIQPEQLEWLARLDADYENLRTALEWALSKDSPEPSLRLCATLVPLWSLHTHLLEGSKWLGTALSKPSRNLDQAERTARVRALYQDAWLANALSDTERMKSSAESSLLLAQKGTDTRDTAIARFCVGVAFERLGDYKSARPLVEQSLIEFREVKDAYWEACSFKSLGWLLEAQGKHKREEWSLQALELARKAGERLNLAETLWAYATSFYVSNRIDEAMKYLEEADILYKQMGFRINRTFETLGRIAWLKGDYEKAKSYFWDLQEHLGLLGEKNNRALIIGHLGLLALEQGDLFHAHLYLKEALAIAQDVGFQSFIVSVLATMGNVFYAEENIEQFKQYYRKSFSLMKEILEVHVSVKPYILLLALNPLRHQSLKNSARILGAIYNFERDNKLINPVVKRYYYQAEAHAREGLGNAAFESAFAEGQKMSLDEALDLVLKIVEEM